MGHNQRVRVKIDLHSSLHQQIITLPNSLLLGGFFSCVIEVYYHPEIRNCLSTPLTHTLHPFIIIQLLLSKKKIKEKKKRSSHPTQTVDKAEKTNTLKYYIL